MVQTKVAVKLFKGSAASSGNLTEILQQFRNEITLSKRLESHPNIVKFIGACLEYPNLCLVLEFMPHGDLLSWMRDATQKSRMTKGLMVRFIEDLVAGLGHLHKLNIVHRDCKSSNCLVSSIDERALVNLKLGDFGLARYVAKSPEQLLKNSLNMGTIQWTAPEVLAGKQPHSKASDVYSFGVILWETIWRQIAGNYRVPYEQPYTSPNARRSAPGTEIERLKKLKLSGDGLELPAASRLPSPVFLTMLKSCLAIDPLKRPNFDDISKLLQDAKR